MFYRSFVQVWASPESRWFKIAKTGHWKKDLISIFWYLAFRKISLLLWWIEACFVNIHQRKINLKLKTNEKNVSEYLERTIKSCEEKYIALFKKKKGREFYLRLSRNNKVQKNVPFQKYPFLVIFAKFKTCENSFISAIHQETKSCMYCTVKKYILKSLNLIYVCKKIFYVNI